MSAAPGVRFCRVPGGKRLAYAVHGSGPPLVCAAWWVSNLEADWDVPGFRRFFTRLGDHCTVIRYDRLGAGLSDRERDRVSLEDEVTALSAVIDANELTRPSILGVACAGPPAIAYAAANPDRVDKLVLWGSFVDGSHVGPPEIRDAVQTLVRASWGMGSTALADMFAPGLDTTGREALARQQRSAATNTMSADLLALTFDMNVVAQAEATEHPALIVHRRGDRAIPFRAGRELAAALPNAQLRAMEGDAHVPWYGDVEDAAEAIVSFVCERSASPDAIADEAAMVRRGDLWTLSFGGRQAHVRHARGIVDLAIVLGTPGTETHVAQLVGEPALQAPTGSDDVLDEQSRRAYKARIEEIDARLEDAELLGSPEAVERLRAERDAVARELERAVGLGGRGRKLHDPTERARKAVTARIRASIKKIAEVHAELGEHLSAYVRTGTFCCYEPPEAPPWRIDQG